MAPIERPDLCVIGATEAARRVAAGAARLGARVLLAADELRDADRPTLPTRALLAASQAAVTVRSAGRFGVNGHEPEIRFDELHGHVNDALAHAGAAIRSDVVKLRGRVRFVSPRLVAVGARMIEPRRIVLALGGKTEFPAIDGLARTPVLTPQTILENSFAPDHLLVIGAGTVGCEMAQAYRRLGSRVTLIDRGPLLSDGDPELTAVVKAGLIGENIDLRENAVVSRVEPRGDRIIVTLGKHAAREEIVGTHLLLATGARISAAELGLEVAGIAVDDGRIAVDRRLQCANAVVWVLGDVSIDRRRTRLAGQHADLAVGNALLGESREIEPDIVPRIVLTDPELAQVGVTQREACTLGHKAGVLRLPFADNPRARAERRTAGQIKIVCCERGYVLGAAIVGLNASELIQPWVLAISQHLNIEAMARLDSPWPSLAESTRRLMAELTPPPLSAVALPRREATVLRRFLASFV
jgi:pyruvate/2-oxoglutarate dehydrogenase complex dihydrolipoamide dehydrogenase (E3) component